VILFLLLTVPSGAPLRNPATGVLIGNSPFMNGLIGVIMVLFLATGIAYGIGAKTMNSSAAVIAAKGGGLIERHHPFVRSHQPVRRLLQLQ
jgi:aminobenzoyl-glutamate transport protein